MPRVSICVPIHNMENGKYFLQRNLDSIFKQTFRDFEVIITDDSEGKAVDEWVDEVYLPYMEKQPQMPHVRYIQNSGMKGMANNTNFAMDNASGQLIKILYMDDYFYNESSLWDIVRHFTPYVMWMVTPCLHDGGQGLFNEHKPHYSESVNTIGSPSVLTMRREIRERFDPQFHWVLDLDLYKRLYRKYGLPKILNRVNVVIGVHGGQMTHILSDQRKNLEFELLKKKYETATS